VIPNFWPGWAVSRPSPASAGVNNLCQSNWSATRASGRREPRANSLLLIKLDRQGLRVPIRVRGLRLYLLWAIAAVFGVLSVWLLLAQI
jgi:hypothetical protein